MSEKASKTKTKTTSKKDASKPKSKSTSKPKAKAKAKTTKKPTTKKAPKKTTPKKPKKRRKTKTTVEAKPKRTRPRRLPLETPVKGVLMNYQRGSVRQRNQYGLIQLQGVSSISTAASYIGRSVILHFNERTQNQGQIVSVHGKKGVLRVRFRRRLAPEALAKEVVVF
ncbi:MAG: 50S ribosomal protein L35ae [Candidatus Hermodarchaeota archaeon]|nr:50S ribosomal protein L35ae [Candidatus Hermodarchaeota archaeon]